jgi:hypothetical protein
MIRRYWLCLAALLAVAALPATARAIPLGGARLISVTAVDGGCVSGPTGLTVQAWDIEPGKTYTLTIDNVTECANGGTDATLDVRVNSSGSGNTDAVATLVAPGTYQFNYTLPIGATCTLPVFYCTTPGDASSGLFTRRSDGGSFESHLRASTFAPGCTNPQQIIGPYCGPTPVHPRTWAQVKTIYR